MEAITILRIEAEPTTLGEWKASKGLPVLAYDRAISTGYDMKFYDRITGELVKHEFYTDAEFSSQYTSEELIVKVKEKLDTEAKAEEVKREAARASLMEKMEAVEEPKEEPKPKTKRKSKAKVEAKEEAKELVEEVKDESEVSGE